MDGPQFCYEGEHRSNPLPQGDLRRTYPECLVIHPSKNGNTLDEKLRRINGRKGLKILILSAGDGAGFDEEAKFSYDIDLPDLEELHI